MNVEKEVKYHGASYPSVLPSSKRLTKEKLINLIALALPMEFTVVKEKSDGIYIVWRDDTYWISFSLNVDQKRGDTLVSTSAAMLLQTLLVVHHAVHEDAGVTDDIQPAKMVV